MEEVKEEIVEENKAPEPLEKMPFDFGRVKLLVVNDDRF
jgi:hypothetical protein